jgi:hypothetical protein
VTGPDAAASEPVERGWGRAAAPADVRRFLEGPQARRSELLLALGIFTEFIRGFRALHFVGPCVTVFGSAPSRARSAGAWPGWASR